MAERPIPLRASGPIRLGRRHRGVVFYSLAVLWSSGALWLLFHYFLAVQGPFGPEPHPLQPWWLRLHGLAVMVTLTVFGSLLVQHAPRAWQVRKNRRLGAALTGVFLWLATTGYALYYFSSDANAAWLPLAHWIPGLALPGVVLMHIRFGRRRTAPRRPAARHCPVAHAQPPTARSAGHNPQPRHASRH